LHTTATRQPTTSNISAVSSRGLGLWNSIYAGFETKLIDKLAESHPDLPVHILNSHYGALLSDPNERAGLAKVGRALTSIVAISCLRAQTGVGPQVLSHVFGLRKAVDDGSWKEDVANVDEVKGVEWLAGDEGSEWILKSVDSIVEGISEGQGSNFAPSMKAKL
jgi:hypothetical protein